MYVEIINFLLIIANFICVILVTKPIEYIATEQQRKKYQWFRAAGYIVSLPVITVAEMALRWYLDDILLVNCLFIIILSLAYKLKLKQIVGMVVLAVAICSISFNLADESIFYNKLDRYGLVLLVIFGLVITFIVAGLIKIYTLKQISSMNNSETIIFTTVSIVSVIVGVYLLISYSDYILCVIGGLVLLIINILTFYLLDRFTQMHLNKMKVTMLEEKNEAIRNQLDVYMESNNKISSIRHDFKNHLFVMEKLLENKKYDELQKYMDNLEERVKPKDKFVNTGNLVIDSIINLKCKAISNMLDKDMEINLAIPSDMKVNEMDICIILGNLFDNAIEALQKCTGKREFSFEMKEKSNMLFIKMKNSFNGEVLKDGPVFTSTKDNNIMHGFGLTNIKDVVEKTDGKMNINYDDRCFTVEIIMYL